jgi:hypothetical protein
MKMKDDEMQLDKINSSTGKPYMFKLSLTDLLRSTMFGTITAVTNDITRMPLKMPGHTSIWWMGILLLGKGVVGKFGSGIIMGLVSGILAVILGLGNEGVFVFFKYFMPGLLIDLLALFFRNKLDSVVVGGICGALMSLSKMIADIVVGMLINIPLLFLVSGLGFVSISHTIYGAIGGVLAAILIKRLKPRLSNWD